MTSTAEEKTFLRVAVAAIPRVAEIILEFLPDDRASALETAERRFLRQVRGFDPACLAGLDRRRLENFVNQDWHPGFRVGRSHQLKISEPRIGAVRGSKRSVRSAWGGAVTFVPIRRIDHRSLALQKRSNEVWRHQLATGCCCIRAWDQRSLPGSRAAVVRTNLVTRVRAASTIDRRKLEFPDRSRLFALCSRRYPKRSCAAVLSSVTASAKHVSRIRRKPSYRKRQLL